MQTIDATHIGRNQTLFCTPLSPVVRMSVVSLIGGQIDRRRRNRRKPARLAWLALAVAVALVACYGFQERLVDLSERRQQEHFGPPMSDREIEGLLLAQQQDTVPPPPPEPAATATVVNKDAVVSILGYHDFTDGKSTGDMVLEIEAFREQLEAIRLSGLPVISMSDYLAWKRGEKSLPEHSVMITMDDGWEAVHRLALPLLREYGYPFTVFFYRKYIAVGGRSLDHDEIREIIAAGGEIGSHSVSHRNLIRQDGRSRADYEAWVRDELVDSLAYLREHFGDTGAVLPVFAYPYGIFSDEVVTWGEESGYEAMVTVNAGRTRWDTPMGEIPRFIVLASSDYNFTLALSRKGGGRLATSTVAAGAGGAPSKQRGKGKGTNESPGYGAGADAGEAMPVIGTRPAHEEVITDRRPVVEIDLSGFEKIEADSVTMRITGLGEVPCEFDPVSSKASFQVPMRLRLTRCGVEVSLRHGASGESTTLAWHFSIDHTASYLEEFGPAMVDRAPSREGGVATR